jgi:hypothetical protein
MKPDRPACIHCGRPIANLIFADWWDIGEVAGWVCAKSASYSPEYTYRKIRRRFEKGLIDLSHHTPPAKKATPLEDVADAYW